MCYVMLIQQNPLISNVMGAKPKFDLCGKSMYAENSFLRKFQGTGKKIDIGGNSIYAGSI